MRAFSSSAAARELTDGRGVDHAFEAIGLAPTIEQAYEALSPGGVAVVVGQVSEGVRASFRPVRDVGP